MKQKSKYDFARAANWRLTRKLYKATKRGKRGRDIAKLNIGEFTFEARASSYGRR